MCKTIDDLLKADESRNEIDLYVSQACLQILVDYCSCFNYLKIKSTLEFPSIKNCVIKCLSEIELTIMTPLRNDIFALEQLFACSKLVQCESLY